MGCLVALGALLRLTLIGVQRPAFVGFSDAAWYMIAARDGVFLNAARPEFSPWPAGYSVFLRGMHQLGGQLFLVTLLQHLLGIATAVLLFLGVRRVAPAAWGLLPAAVVLLAGPQLFLEHAPMPEALFGFLLACLVLCALAAVDRGSWVAALSAGALAAAAGSVRLVGLALIPVVAIWLLATCRRPWRRGLTAAVLALVGAGLVIGVYLAEMKHETGYGGPTLTRSGPPVAGPGSNRHPGRLAPDLVRFWSSDVNHENGGLGYDAFVKELVVPRNTTEIAGLTPWYSTMALVADAGALDVLRSYERATRLQGLPFVLLLVLALGGLPLARGRRLAFGLLALAIAAVVMLGPLLYAQFDARYVVPGYGSLAAAAAIGAASLWERLAQSRASRRRARAPVAVGG